MAISLLMEALPQDQNPTISGPFDVGERSWKEAEPTYSTGNEHGKERQSHEKQSDNVLAATAILSVYEFLDASGAAWSRHLNGTKSLLDIAQTKLISVEVPAAPGCFQSLHELKKPSAARKAIFWNFARQDCLAACTSLLQSVKY